MRRYKVGDVIYVPPGTYKLNNPQFGKISMFAKFRCWLRSLVETEVDEMEELRREASCSPDLPGTACKDDQE